MASQAVAEKAPGNISLFWKEVLIAWSFVHGMVHLFLHQAGSTSETHNMKGHLGEGNTTLFALLVVTSSWSLEVSFPVVDIARIPHPPLLAHTGAAVKPLSPHQDLIKLQSL